MPTSLTNRESKCLKTASNACAIIRSRPQLAETFATILAERQAENDATLQALDDDARAVEAVSRTRDLMRKIQRFFGL